MGESAEEKISSQNKWAEIYYTLPKNRQHKLFVVQSHYIKFQLITINCEILQIETNI